MTDETNPLIMFGAIKNFSPKMKFASTLLRDLNLSIVALLGSNIYSLSYIINF